MKKWFTNWISGLRNGADFPYPEHIESFKNIAGKPLRLKPINKFPKNQSVFNCMFYLIFCPKHQKIAICDNPDIHEELAVLPPFVYVSSDYNQRLKEEEGLSLILSDGDSQLLAKYKEERPFDTNVSNVTRIDLEQFEIGYTVFWCFARLHSDNPVVQCCRKTSRILWINVEDFQNDDLNCSWAVTSKAKEFLKIWDRIRIYNLILTDSILQWARTYRFENEPQNQGQMILKALKVTEKHIDLFLFDFFEHCFPTNVMSFLSFKVYLRKYCEFFVEDKWLKRLFNACADFSTIFGSSVKFHSFLIGLSYIDSECPSLRCRVQFIFRYYDINRDGYLSEEELREMVRDIDTNQSQKEIERVVSDNMFMNESEKGMTFEEFEEFQMNGNWLEGTHGLCRFDFPILRKILSNLENREKSGFKKRLNQYFRRLLND